MEAVHVLFRGNGHEDRFLVDGLGQGKLAEDAIDLLPGVELFDEGDEFDLGGGFRQGVLLAEKAAFLTVLALAVDIDPAGGVVPHDDHGQTGGALQRSRLLFDPFLALGRQGLAV